MKLCSRERQQVVQQVADAVAEAMAVAVTDATAVVVRVVVLARAAAVAGGLRQTRPAESRPWGPCGLALRGARRTRCCSSLTFRLTTA